MSLSLKNISSGIREENFDLPEIKNIRIEEIGLEQIERLRGFYLKNYKFQHILGDRRLFGWQFRNNKSKVTVLSKEGEIIAHHGSIPVVFTDGEDDYKGNFSANVVVDNDYRRKGLMSFLLEKLGDQFQIMANLGASIMGMALYDAMGYKNYGSLTRWVAIIHPDKCFNIVKNADALRATVEINPAVQNHAVRTIRSFKEIENEVNNLWRATFPPKTFFGIKRDADFLDWRYTEHPYFRYQCYGWWEGNNLGAVLVYRKEHVGEVNTYVIRMTEFFGQKEYMAKLLQATILNSKESKDIGWADWSCPNRFIGHILESLGFVALKKLLPVEIPLLCQPIDYHKTEYTLMFWARDKHFFHTLPEFNRWYITKGDGDADRPNRL